MLLAIVTVAEGVVKVSVLDENMKKMVERGGCSSEFNTIWVDKFRFEVLSSMVRFCYRPEPHVILDLGSLRIDHGTLNYPIFFDEGADRPRVGEPFKLSGFIDFLKQHADGIPYKRLIWARSSLSWNLAQNMWEDEYDGPRINKVFEWLKGFEPEEASDIRVTHRRVRNGVEESMVLHLKQLSLNEDCDKIHVAPMYRFNKPFEIQLDVEPGANMDDFIIYRIGEEDGLSTTEPLGYLQCRWTRTGFAQKELYRIS